MSDAFDWKNLRCLYAEDLHNKRVTLTIAAVRDTPAGARMFCHGDESKSWDVAFAERGKDGATPYLQMPCPNQYGKRSGLLRGYTAATGSDPAPAHVGTKVTLYPVKSTKSATGQAIRIAVPEQMA